MTETSQTSHPGERSPVLDVVVLAPRTTPRRVADHLSQKGFVFTGSGRWQRDPGVPAEFVRLCRDPESDLLVLDMQASSRSERESCVDGLEHLETSTIEALLGSSDVEERKIGLNAARMVLDRSLLPALESFDASGITALSDLHARVVTELQEWRDDLDTMLDTAEQVADRIVDGRVLARFSDPEHAAALTPTRADCRRIFHPSVADAIADEIERDPRRLDRYWRSDLDADRGRWLLSGPMNREQIRCISGAALTLDVQRSHVDRFVAGFRHFAPWLRPDIHWAQWFTFPETRNAYTLAYAGEDEWAFIPSPWRLEVFEHLKSRSETDEPSTSRREDVTVPDDLPAWTGRRVTPQDAIQGPMPFAPSESDKKAAAKVPDALRSEILDLIVEFRGFTNREALEEKESLHLLGWRVFDIVELEMQLQRRYGVDAGNGELHTLSSILAAVADATAEN